MNPFNELWDGFNAALIEKKETLGIQAVEKAEPGKAVIAKTPGILTWIDFDLAKTTAQGKVYSVSVDLYAFCVAEAGKSTAEAVSDAIEIATKTMQQLSGSSISGCDIEVSDPPLEIIDKSSSKAVVAAIFTTKVRLT